MNELLRFWHLKQMSRSPMHYQHALTGPEADPTYDMERGDGVHSVVFSTKPVVGYLPGKKRDGKDFEAWKAKQPDGALILTASEYEKVCRMAEAVWNHGDAMSLMFPRSPKRDVTVDLSPMGLVKSATAAPPNPVSGVSHETTIHFDYMGRAARATPDALTPDALVELKTSQTSEPEQFMRHAKRMWYHGQLAFYEDAIQAKGGNARDAYIVAVESSAPYPVTILRLTPRTLDLGARACRLWFERLKACETAGTWPPYVQSVVDWDIEEDFELEFADDGEPIAEVA